MVCRTVSVIVLAAVASGAAALVAEATETPSPARPRTVVLLVDVSTSMDERIVEVRRALSGFVDHLQRGEQCIVYGFGDRVQRLAQQTITSAQDRTALQKQIAAIQPTDRYTDITSGVQRGLILLKREFAAAPEKLHVLIVVTDGRHNPRDPRAPTFASLLDVFPDFRPGEQWFLHYVVLGDVDDPEATQFVQACGGALSHTKTGDDLQVILGALPVPATGRILDRSGQCTVQRGTAATPVATDEAPAIVAGSRVHTGKDARAVVGFGTTVQLGLEPETSVEIVTAEWDVFAQAGRLHVRLLEGALEMLTWEDAPKWAVSVETTEELVTLLGTRLRLTHSPQDTITQVGVHRGAVDVTVPDWGLTTRVEAGEYRTVPRDTTPGPPQSMSKEWEELAYTWNQVFAQTVTLRELRLEFAALALRNLHIRLGPVDAGTPVQTTVPLPLRGLPDSVQESLSVEPEHSLPTGITFSASLGAPQKDGGRGLTLTAAAVEGHEFSPGTEIPSRLTVRTVAMVRIANIPVTIIAGNGGAGIIETVSPVTATARSILEAMRAWAPIFAGGIALVGCVSLVYWQARIRVQVGGHSVGRLLVLSNPLKNRLRMDAIVLDEFLEGKRSCTLTIGRGKECDIRLPHSSVAALHCTLTVWRSRGNAGVDIQGTPESTTLVNHKQVGYRKPTELKDQANIGIGGFVLLYEDTGSKSQIVVHFASGESMDGVLHSWDMSATSFRFAPMKLDAQTDREPVWDVRFQEVEDIFMMPVPNLKARRQKGRRTPAPGDAAAQQREMHVTFKSGRELHGHVWPDYRDDAPMFALIPTDTDHIDYAVIVRRNTKKLRARVPTPPRREKRSRA